MTLIIIEQCQCAYCCASRALDVLRGLPYMPDDGRAALDAIEAALDELEEKGFARWDAMNDVATAAGLNWMDATQQDIVGAIEQTRARVTELEADNANWREALRMTNDALKAAHSDLMEMARWRLVTEKPTAPGRYLVWCPAPWPGYEIAPYDRGWGYIDLRFTHWQPLPPAPDAQEPTP